MNEYLWKHIIKSEYILRRLAYPHKRGKHFVNIEHNHGKFIDSEKANGRYNPNNNTIEINNEFFEKMYKRKYDKKLIRTIQHELIHYWIDKHCSSKNIKLLYADSSPLFALVVSYFNKRGCDIGQNYSLKYEFELFNKEMLSFSENMSYNFENMEVYIQDWINKLDKVIDNYQEKVNNINAEHGTEKVIICTFSFNWENSGDNSNLVTYKKVRYLNNIFLAELNDIRFGIDLNLFTTQKYFTAEDTLDFMIGLHEEYEEEHAEENHRYYMNTIEDAEIIETYYKK